MTNKKEKVLPCDHWATECGLKDKDQVPLYDKNVCSGKTRDEDFNSIKHQIQEVKDKLLAMSKDEIYHNAQKLVALNDLEAYIHYLLEESNGEYYQCEIHIFAKGKDNVENFIEFVSANWEKPNAISVLSAYSLRDELDRFIYLLERGQLT